MNLVTKRPRFDSGGYLLPTQRIEIDGRGYFTDSLLISVANVPVDTVNQKMYDIKPLMGVDADRFGWLKWVGLGLLLALLEKFDGGPVGVESLSAAISEARGTIEDVLEPYLIQQGYMVRTPRGRMVTRNAYLHFGLPAPASPREEAGNLPLDFSPGSGDGD